MASTRPALQGELDALKTTGDAPSNAVIADPLAATKLQAQIPRAGDPVGDPDRHLDVDLSPLPATSDAVPANAPEAPGAGPTAEQLAAAQDRANDAVEATAAREAQTSERSAATNSEGLDKQARERVADAAQTFEDGNVVARIEPPKSVDSDGNSVPTHLEVRGDRVTMVVDHGDGEFTYPIAADPAVVVFWPVLHHEPVYREETYVASWNPVWAAAGSTPGYWIAMHTSSDLGGGWYTFFDSGLNNHVLMHYDGWTTYSTYYVLVWQPVYATRVVFSHWNDYWTYTPVLVDSSMSSWSYDDPVESGDADAGSDSYELIAASTVNRGCRKSKMHVDVGPFVDIDYTVRWCWNERRHRANWDHEYQNVDSKVNLPYGFAGIGSSDRWIGYEPYTFDGYSSGGARMKGETKITGAYDVVSLELQTVTLTMNGHYDGTIDKSAK